MTQQQHDNLDHLLTRHFKATLEPQVGRAGEAFRRQLQATAGAPVSTDAQMPAPPPPPIPFPQTPAKTLQTIARPPRGNLIPRRALWYWAGVPSLVAACLAVVITLQFFNGNKVASISPAPMKVGTRSNPASSGTIVFDTPQLNQYETSRDINGGIAVLNDDTPVRVFHREGMRQTQWVDPGDHATYSLTEPVEKVGYVRVQPY